MPSTGQSNEELQRFVGGEAEIQNSVEGYFYRGLIAEIRIDEERRLLTIRFAWLAKNRGGPFGSKTPPSPDWDLDERLDYAADIDLYSVSDPGAGRLVFDAWVTNETVTIFPSDGSAVNPAKINGLTAEQS